MISTQTAMKTMAIMASSEMFFVRMPDRESFGDRGFFCIELEDDLRRDLIGSIVIVITPLIEVRAEGGVGADERIIIDEFFKHI